MNATLGRPKKREAHILKYRIIPMVEDTHFPSKVLTIPSSIDEIDIDLSTVLLCEGDVCNCNLPSSLQEMQSQPLLESALMQWIATRWRNVKIGTLVSSNSNTDEEGAKYLKHLANTAPGTLLSMLPTGKIKGITPRVSSKFRSLYISNQNKWPGLALSDWMMLMCVDSRKKDFPPQLYRTPISGEVADWDAYDFVVKGLMKSVAEKPHLLNLSDSISTIFYELFKNTHDHARIGIDGNIIGDSIRSIYARYYPANKLSHYTKKIASLNESISPLDWYFQTMLNHHSSNISGFLELSVIDMGPGLAAKWLSQSTLNCSGKEQYDAVISCLEKGNSSMQRNGRGFGLWNVLQVLKKQKGFIRIRTNQVHAYRQYAILPDLGMKDLAGGGKTLKEVLYDWKRVHVTSQSDYPSVEGTLISVLLPLGDA